jgi:endonuclease/exonuclease/phosphatase family metal-dependent hydrolase
MIENSKINYENIIIVGDFNTDYMPDNNRYLKLNTRYLNNIFLKYHMQQTVKQKTCPQNNSNSSSIIDLDFVKNNSINEVKVIPNSKNVHKNCDHFALSLTIPIKN